MFCSLLTFLCDLEIMTCCLLANNLKLMLTTRKEINQVRPYMCESDNKEVGNTCGSLQLWCRPPLSLGTMYLFAGGAVYAHSTESAHSTDSGISDLHSLKICTLPFNFRHPECVQMLLKSLQPQNNSQLSCPERSCCLMVLIPVCALRVCTCLV